MIDCRMRLARRRGGGRISDLKLRISDCVSACALRGYGVTGCGFLEIRFYWVIRGIRAANDASSQPAARKLAYPCPPESRSAQEDVNFVNPV